MDRTKYQSISLTSANYTDATAVHPPPSRSKQRSSSLERYECIDIDHGTFLGVTVPTPVVSLVLLTFVVSLFVVGMLSSNLAHNGCDPSPYIYITERNTKNIKKISRNGCMLTTKVLWFSGGEADRIKESDPSYRSMAAPPSSASSNGRVYLVDAANSRAVILDDCSRIFGQGMRKVLGNVPFSEAEHPYGIAFDDDGAMFVSFQHHNAVLKYVPAANGLFSPAAVPLGLVPIFTNATYKTKGWERGPLLNGTFVQFNLPGMQNYEDQGVRSIAWVRQSGPATYRFRSSAPSPAPSTEPSPSPARPTKGPHVASAEGYYADREIAELNQGYGASSSSTSSPTTAAIYSYLWICEENTNRVYIVDAEGALVETVKVKKPIGIYVDYAKSIVLIGSKGKKKEGGGGVTSFDIASRRAMRSFSLIGMNHPTGVLVHEDSVYVADQGAGAVYLFDYASGRFVKNIYPHGVDALEQIFLTTC